MCRNITVLRGLEPPVSDDEILDAARQFIRKVAGLQSPHQMARDDVRHAIDQVTAATRELLGTLPPRRTAPAGPTSRRGAPATPSSPL